MGDVFLMLLLLSGPASLFLVPTTAWSRLTIVLVKGILSQPGMDLKSPNCE